MHFKKIGLNEHKADSPVKIGVAFDKNNRCRRVMEDAHAFVYDYGGVSGQVFAAIFDGHAGRQAANWCGANFHRVLQEQLQNSTKEVPFVINDAFHAVDRQLLAGKSTNSGCTAAVVFVRYENGDGVGIGPGCKAGSEGKNAAPKTDSPASGPASPDVKAKSTPKFFDKLHDTFRSITGKGDDFEIAQGLEKMSVSPPNAHEAGGVQTSSPVSGATTSSSTVPTIPVRKLYTANVGDARAVLCRKGTAVRLTYDHKGSDRFEAKRVTEAGGYMLNNRVNGVLAVTRSLGDSSMKDFVVGSPFTTETILNPSDSFIIVACDGLWDVCTDQAAVDLVKDVEDPGEASQKLIKYALDNYSSDNLSVIVVRF